MHVEPIWLAIALCSAAMSASAAPAAIAACDAALDLTKTFVDQRMDGKPWIVSENDGLMTRADLSEILAQKKWPKDPPPTSLIRAYLTAHPSAAVVRCPSLRKFLADTGVAHGDKAVAHASLDVWYSANILWLSLPVVSANGREALVDVALSGGTLAASSRINHLRRRADGRWVSVDLLVIGIS